MVSTASGKKWNIYGFSSLSLSSSFSLFTHHADTSAHYENNESNRTDHGRRQWHRQRSGHGHHLHEQQQLLLLLLIVLLHTAHNKWQTGAWLAAG